MQYNVLRTVIVEDEKPAREVLVKLLSKNCPEVEVVAEAGNVSEGISSIRQLHPDLILLDVQLQTERSFSILEALTDYQYQVVFATAHQEYAVNAFKFAAVDYLMKPINPVRLSEAIRRAKRNLETNRPVNTIELLLNNLKAETQKGRKIVLSTMDMMHVVELTTIICCQSTMNYTTFFLEDGEQIIVSRTLKEFDKQLTAFDFFRAHRSWLINQHQVKGYSKREGGEIIMSDDRRIPVSPVKKEHFLKILKGSI